MVGEEEKARATSLDWPFLEDECLGQPAYLVGGGPSLSNFNWELLRDRPNVIVVNRAFMDVPTAMAFFTEDLQVVSLYAGTSSWREFQGVKIFHALAPEYEALARELDPEIKFIRKVRRDKRWSKLFAEGLSSSSNSMIGALNLADLLGCDPIYLLGVDCKSVGKGQANFHNDYEKAGFRRAGDHQYESFRNDFTWWAAPNLASQSCEFKSRFRGGLLAEGGPRR